MTGRTKHPKGKAKRPKATKEQVRAWLSSVIAPLRAGLGLELQFLGKNNPTFRAHGEVFEFLSYVDQMLPSIYTPNLLQFWRFYPDLEREAAQHDALLVRLHDSCRSLYGRLIALSAFLSLADSATESHGPANLPLEEDRKYFAEYVINGLSELEWNKSHRDFWTVNGPKFLALRDQSPLADDFRSLARNVGDLRDSAQKLFVHLVATQDELADRFGLPPVDPNPVGAG